MIKRIWDFLGDIRLSFWLLLAAAALFLAGMFHSSFDYSYFRAMNELRIQDWLARELPSRPGANWWLPLLVCVLFLLGVNTVICTINRVIALFAGPKRSGIPLHAVAPSVDRASPVHHGNDRPRDNSDRGLMDPGADLPRRESRYR